MKKLIIILSVIWQGCVSDKQPNEKIISAVEKYMGEIILDYKPVSTGIMDTGYYEQDKTRILYYRVIAIYAGPTGEKYKILRCTDKNYDVFTTVEDSETEQNLNR